MNKWINLPLTMVLAFCGIWASPAAFARIVVVGVETTQQMPYYGMCGEDYCGYGKELLDRFASDMDFTIKYRPMPILRLHRELIDGRIDLKFPASADWQPHLKKNKAIRYSAPLADYIDGVMMLSPPSADIHRLGTIHGFTLDVFGQQLQGIDIIYANGIPELVQMLYRGRVDAVFANIKVTQYHLHAASLASTPLEFRQDLPNLRDGYHVSSLASPELIDLLDSWLGSHANVVALLKDRFRLADITRQYEGPQ